MPKQDYGAFASQFLDLWQDQMTRAMSDTDFLQSLMDNMQQMQNGFFGHEQQKEPKHKHTADASESGALQLADLQQRLAACERKIAKLEAKLDRLKAKPEKKPKAAKESSASKASGSKAKPTKRVARAKPAATKKAKPTPKKPAAKPKAPRKRAIKRGS